MRLLGKKEIEACAVRKTEDVAVPEWGDGVGVRVRSITVAEHKDFTSRLKEGDDDATIAASLMVVACVDETGSPLFTEADAAMLLAQDASAVKRIGRAAMRLNGLGKMAVEDARKNS